MSLLAQLYLAGLATLSLPLLFHLLRRSPRGVLPYSSLMFLSPSPPRLTRRSRIDHWLLLLLRVVALTLLAAAFCRPYWREDSLLAQQARTGRRVAVLVDTSASMRRAGLWQQAERAFDEAIDALKPDDSVALFAFDNKLRAVADYSDDAQQQRLQVEAVRSAFPTLRPTWSATSTGAALATLAARLESMEDRLDEQRPLQIVLISDLAEGSDLAALQGAAWPERVAVEVKPLASPLPNASVQLLQRGEAETDPLAVRLRVLNDGEAKAELRLAWGGDAEPSSGPTAKQRKNKTEGAPGSPDDDAVEANPAEPMESVETPAKGSKVIRLKRAPEQAAADRVQLTGDAHSFDNTFYLAPPVKRELRLTFWGDDRPEDAEGLRFYFENAAATTPYHELAVEAVASGDLPQAAALADADLVVVTAALEQAQAARAREAALAGARLLLVLSSPDAQSTLNKLAPDGVECEVTEAGGGYALLTDVDFQHPVFAPLASARYNDFTKVQFWHHRSVRWNGRSAPPEDAVRLLARFDDGDAAAAQWPLGKGEVVLLTSGWRPDDSRLALSTKFVPLAASLLDPRQFDRSALQFAVGDIVARDLLPEALRRQPLRVLLPDGEQADWAADQAFGRTSKPGIYRVAAPAAGESPTAFAVNIAAAESRTAPLDERALADNGVRLGQSLALGVGERQRQRKNAELEGRQKLWQWLVAACLVVLIAETLLAGWYARQAERQDAAVNAA